MQDQYDISVRAIGHEIIKLHCNSIDFVSSISLVIDGEVKLSLEDKVVHNCEISLPAEILDGKFHEISINTLFSSSENYYVIFDPTLSNKIHPDKDIRIKEFYLVLKEMFYKLENVFENQGYNESSKNFDAPLANYNSSENQSIAENEIDPNLAILFIEYFDIDFYRSQLIDSNIELPQNYLNHYLQTGEKLGLLPNDWFNPQDYFKANLDVQDAGVGAFYHYVLAGKAEGRATAPVLIDEADREKVFLLFDPIYYRTTYDVSGNDDEVFLHFLTEGHKNLSNPNALFSAKAYLDLNPDLALAQVNPFVHYVTIGKKEGRVSNIELGFRHKVLLDLQRYSDKNALVLSEEYETQHTLVRDCKKYLNPQQPIAFSISHDNFIENVGGLQLCVRREAKEFVSRNFNYVHLYPSKAMLLLDRNDIDPIVGISINMHIVGWLKISSIIDTFRNIVNQHEDSFFIVHNFLGHNVETLTQLFRSANVTKGYFWIHDYAAICSGLNLLRNDVQFCNAPEITSRACSLCVHQSERASQVHQHSLFFNAFRTKIVAPSQTALEIWTSKANHKYADKIVHPHCQIQSLKSRDRSNNTQVRVAFLGFPASHKGWPVFEKLSFDFENSDMYKFYHFCSVKCQSKAEYIEVDSEIEELNMYNQLKKHKIDVAIIWSICAETFCLVAHEAVAAGLKIIARKDSGHLAKFVSEGKHGLVLSDEIELHNVLSSGAAHDLIHKNAAAKYGKLVFSNMTVDLL